MAQDSPGCSEIGYGNPSDICRKVLLSKDIYAPRDILISRLHGERSPLSERWTLTVKLRSMGLLISSRKDWKGSMLWLQSLFIERDWWSNKRIKSSSLFLFQLRVILSIFCFRIQRERSKFSSRCY